MKLQGLIIAASILSIGANSEPRRLRKGEVRRHLAPEARAEWEGEADDSTTDDEGRTPLAKEGEETTGEAKAGEYIEVTGDKVVAQEVPAEVVAGEEVVPKGSAEGGSMRLAPAAAGSMSMAKAEKTFVAAREGGSMPLDSKAGKPLTAEGGSMRLVDGQVATMSAPVPKADKLIAEGGSMRLTADGEPMSMAKADKTLADAKELGSMPLDSKAGKPLTAEGGSMRLVENQLVTTAVPKAEKVSAASMSAPAEKKKRSYLLLHHGP